MNDDQLAAVMTRVRNVLVSAGAGSGKTSVLTQRYFHLLEEHYQGRPLRVDEILTLTFTRKAAQEMRERIARKLDDEGRPYERRELSRAPIGTIHGFCESILREHALDAGIDPNFRLLDDAEARMLQENALDAIFEDLWTGTQTEREEIGRLLLDYAQRTLRGGLLSVFHAARTRGALPAQLAPIPPAPLAPLAAELCHAVEALLALDGSKGWREYLAHAAATYETLQPALTSARGFSWETYDAVRAAVSGALTPPGGPKDTAKAARDAIKAAAGNWQAAYLDLAAQPVLSAFLLLLARFDARYREAKEGQGLLDFEDLLLLTHALLCREEAGTVDHLKTKFRQIMVDEFQDTNPLQFSIIAALQGSGQLFMVGDVKQAIYRFIGSDIRVFLAQEQRILGMETEGLRLPMHLNYRTRPQVLEPLNALFARLWPLDAFTDGFRFEPLSAAGTFIAKTLPAIELAFWPCDADSAAARRDYEAQWIARRILQLTGQVAEPALEITAKSDDPERAPAARPAHFEDIMLLFRASTDIALYEDALRHAGIPYYVVSGRGFYHTREVQDLLHLLRVLENPMDDFSLAVVLRSPLVGVCDDTLYWLTRDWAAWTDNGQPYPSEPRPTPRYGGCWANLTRREALPALDEIDRGRLRRFHHLVDELQGQVMAGQPLDLIDIIIARTNYLSVLLAADGGEQQAANVQKLREVAAKFQARGIFDLADFQRYLTQLSVQAPREASAPLDVEGSDVVRLMTIHAAKGLEAPIVFLADGGREPNPLNDHFLFTAGGIACLTPTPDGDMARPAAYLSAAAQLTCDDRREAERLLYVALTRAREHLVCCGFTKYPEPEKRASYADLLAGLLDLSGPLEEDTDLPVTFEEFTYPVRVWSPASLLATSQLAPPAQAPTLWEEYTERLSTGRELPLLTPADEVERFAALYDRLQPLPRARHDGPLRIGVHRALCYHACPRQYWFRFVLQQDRFLPRTTEEERELPPADDDEAERLDGTEFGKVLHAVMQRVDFTRPLPAQLPAILTELQQPTGGMAVLAMKDAVTTPQISTLDTARLELCLRAVAKLPLLAELRLATTLHRELRFLLREQHTLVPGIIDLLAETPQGWWLLDYKTGKPSANHLRQLALYALGVEHALGIIPAHVTLVYFDADGGPATVRDEPVTPALLAEARRLIREVSEGVCEEKFLPTPGQQCRHCSCAPACPDAQKTLSSQLNLLT